MDIKITRESLEMTNKLMKIKDVDYIEARIEDCSKLKPRAYKLYILKDGLHNLVWVTTIVPNPDGKNTLFYAFSGENELNFSFQAKTIDDVIAGINSNIN